MEAPAVAHVEVPEQTLCLPHGERFVVRQVRPQDADAEQVFVRSLSTMSRVLRFHVGIRELSPDQLRAMTQVDPRRHVALVVRHGGASGPIVADARYVRDDTDDTQAEFAIAVADEWQGHGFGRHLLSTLVDHARRHGVRRVIGDVLHENRRMIALVRDAGGRFERVIGEARVTRAVFDLRASSTPGEQGSNAA